ncbi:hypothetical protein EDD18DRAFT_1105727 [Armillaria luteobubalina]|uniref:RNA helicase n=1 Tax=Armillaria luteobubalina TaxID=153913 RepID=A0AA39Q6R7_9AGAR|nr:hypothetical protein EDD18DRAFT_1105727 [Armillaria luteobubalina]
MKLATVFCLRPCCCGGPCLTYRQAFKLRRSFSVWKCSSSSYQFATWHEYFGIIPRYTDFYIEVPEPYNNGHEPAILLARRDYTLPAQPLSPNFNFTAQLPHYPYTAGASYTIFLSTTTLSTERMARRMCRTMSTSTIIGDTKSLTQELKATDPSFLRAYELSWEKVRLGACGSDSGWKMWVAVQRASLRKGIGEALYEKFKVDDPPRFWWFLNARVAHCGQPYHNKSCYNTKELRKRNANHQSRFAFLSHRRSWEECIISTPALITMPVGWCYDSVSPGGCRHPPGTCPLRHDIAKCNCGLILDARNYEAHVHGQRHQQILADALRPISKRGKAGPMLKRFWEDEFEAHVATHTVQERLAVALEDAQRNKNGIEVSDQDGLDFGIVDEDEQHSVVVDMLLQRTGGDDSSAPISLSKIRMLSSQRQDEHGTKFSVAITPTSTFIRCGCPHTILVTFHPSYAGCFEDTLELVFVDVVKRRRFVIQRKINATVGSRADHEYLAPKAPYTRRKRRNIKLDGPVKRSLRPPTWTPTKWISKLPRFNVPQHLIQAVYTEKGYLKKSARQDIKGFMPSSFNIDTQDLDAYSLSDVEIKPVHPRYELQVKGLSEGRPSVLVGDFILVRPVGQPDKTWFEGRVHHVAMSCLKLAFSDKFIPIVETSPEHLRDAQPVSPDELEALIPLNRSLGDNPEQLETVAAIVHQPRGSVPFIVFGPPGTGKTVTIVEAMEQLLQRHPEAHILACTPRNKAADLIAQRLLHLGPTDIFRLNSLSRKYDDLPKTLRQFSLVNGNLNFAMPAVEDVIKHRVVVCTCVSAGALASLGVKPGHFGWIFIDEAGQATEPDTMIPIKGLTDSQTNVILAGDSKQIMELLKNFRSHPAILAFPNAHFYGNRLQAYGDPLLTRSLEDWEGFRRESSQLYFMPWLKKKILDLFYQDSKLENISVGSVEEFQGQSSYPLCAAVLYFVASDIRRSLGFVASPQRFNVAVTRAQALLIIVGNADVLALDPVWRTFMNYVHTMGGWCGPRISWDSMANVDDYVESVKSRAAGEAQETITRLKSLVVGVSEGGGFIPPFDSDDDEIDGGLGDGLVEVD